MLIDETYDEFFRVYSEVKRESKLNREKEARGKIIDFIAKMLGLSKEEIDEKINADEVLNKSFSDLLGNLLGLDDQIKKIEVLQCTVNKYIVALVKFKLLGLEDAELVIKTDNGKRIIIEKLDTQTTKEK